MSISMEEFNRQCECNLSYVSASDRIVVEIGQGHLKELYQAALNRIGELEEKLDEGGEINLFKDMTYEAARERYTEARNKLLNSIHSGDVSASMSGIDFYPKDWDDFEPEEWRSNLFEHLSWNGVRLVKVNALELLNAKHPKSHINTNRMLELDAAMVERDALVANALKSYKTPNPNLAPFDLAMSAITAERNARNASDSIRKELASQLSNKSTEVKPLNDSAADD